MERILQKLSESGARDSVDRMYEEALEPFHENSGTRYPSTPQDTIDYQRASFFRHPNKTILVSPLTATHDLLKHNNANIATIPAAERSAIHRLASATYSVRAGAPYGSDLAIKAFSDLDLIFFGGHLGRNVCVSRSSHDIDPRLRCPSKPWATIWGVTLESQHPSERNQCRIVLNAETIFGEGMVWPLEKMMATLLHEMCHAYEIVRCKNEAREGDGLGHDCYFETRVSVVHERAMWVLGMGVIDEGEGFRQRHFL